MGWLELAGQKFGKLVLTQGDSSSKNRLLGPEISRRIALPSE
jgi:hypothetical protein